MHYMPYRSAHKICSASLAAISQVGGGGGDLLKAALLANAVLEFLVFANRKL